MSHVMTLTDAVMNDVLRHVDEGLPAWEAAETCRVPRHVHMGWMMTGAEDVEAGKDTPFARYHVQVVERGLRARQRMLAVLRTTAAG